MPGITRPAITLVMEELCPIRLFLMSYRTSVRSNTYGLFIMNAQFFIIPHKQDVYDA